MLKEYLSTLADSFREILGTTDKINAQDFVNKIQEVYGEGYIVGGEEGHTVGYNIGLKEGKLSEYDRFWDAYQDNGNRTAYGYAFAGVGWTKETFKPKYPMVMSSGGYCFYTTNQIEPYGDSTAIDFTDIPLDTSNIKAATYMFANSNCKNITVDFSNCTSLNYTFTLGGGGYLNNITLKVSEKLTSVSNPFGTCQTLTTFRFTDDSVVACNGFDFHWSNLSPASLRSIINALADKSADTSGTKYTITLGTSNLDKLTDAEKAIATQKGWTLA